MKALMCLLLGGHHWLGPRVVEGRVRLVCGYGCGATSEGIETLGQQRLREQRTVLPFNLNLLVHRGQRKRVA